MKVIFVLVDVGQEIDDEILLWWLQRRAGYRFVIIFSGPGDLSDEESRRIWLEEFNPHMGGVCTGSSYSYITLGELQSQNHAECDCFLMCASAKGYNGSNLTINDKLFLQGDMEAVDKETSSSSSSMKGTRIVVPGCAGVNAQGSRELLLRFEAKLVVIGSAQCVEMRPVVGWLKLIPDFLYTKIQFVGFKLMLGRIQPGVVVGGGVTLSKNIAPGLLSRGVGRAANFAAVEAFVESTTHTRLKDFGPGGGQFDTSRWARGMIVAENYFKSVFETDKLEDDIQIVRSLEEGPVWFDWQRRTTLECAAMANLGIEIILPGVWDRRDMPFYSTFNEETEDPEILTALHAYSTALSRILKEEDDDIVVRFLNPAYDLFAGYVLLQYLEGGDVAMQQALRKTSPQDMFAACSD